MARLHGTRSTPGALLVLALLATGCAGLTPEEEGRLATFKQNSKRFYEEGQLRRAEDQCRKGLRIDPDDFSLNLLLGYSLLRQQGSTRVQEAAGVFERCIDLEDEFDVRPRLGLGEANLELARLWENVAVAAEKDETLTPAERKERVRGARERRDECYAKSEEVLREVLDSPKGRDDSTARTTLARLYAVQARYPESAAVLRELVASLTRSLHTRGEGMDVASLPPERRQSYEAMLGRLRDQLSESLKLLSSIAHEMGRHEEVIAVYAQVEALERMQPADYYNRARAYEALGARDAAIADYERFISQAAGRGAAYTDSVGQAMRRVAALRDGAPLTRES